MISPELAAAFHAAQSQVRNAKKDSKNPHFKSNYADLASVWDACREALHSNGLAVMQSAGPLHEDGKLVGIAMDTTIVHVSGAGMTTTCVVPARNSSPQDYGSAITYARRYGLANMVGVVADDDDDGNKATANDRKAVQIKAAFLPQDDGAWERRIQGHKTLQDCKDDKENLLEYVQGDQTNPLFLKLAARAGELK